MPDRATVNESAQWAIEATSGTAVPADKTVRSMSIEIDVAGEGENFRPDGHKWGQLVIPPNTEWTTWALSGKPTYTEICYPFESIFGTAAVVASGTGKKRVYTIQDVVADTAKTLTVEKGSAVRAAKLAYGLITDWALSFSRKNGVSLTGGGIGQLLSDGITMTASPSDVALVPIVGKELDLFIDATAAALGTTKMLRAFLVELGVGNKYGPVWPINSALSSFAGHVELVPTGTATVRLEADAAGMAFLSQFRSGDTIFARLLATSPKTYDTGLPYKLQYDTALGILGISDFGRDEDGVTIVNLTCEFTKNAVQGAAVTLATSLAADDIVDTAAPHGFAVDDTVKFTALTGGAGLTVGTTYYVTATSFGASTFRPSATLGGAPIDFTTDITAGTVVKTWDKAVEVQIFNGIATL